MFHLTAPQVTQGQPAVKPTAPMRPVPQMFAPDIVPSPDAQVAAPMQDVRSVKWTTFSKQPKPVDVNARAVLRKWMNDLAEQYEAKRNPEVALLYNVMQAMDSDIASGKESNVFGLGRSALVEGAP